MTMFELVTVLLSSLAVLLSLYTLREQRRLQNEANDLQRSTDQLARYELEAKQREASEKLKAQVDVDLTGSRGDYWLRIGCHGASPATNIAVRFTCNRLTVNEDEFANKLPITRLFPGSYVSVAATIYLEETEPYDGVLSWYNADGSYVEEEFTLHRPD